MQICTRCKVEKDDSQFSPDKRRVRGLQSACKACVNIYQRSYSKTEYRKNYNKIKREEYLKSRTEEERKLINQYKSNRLKTNHDAYKKRQASLLKYNKSEHGKYVINNREKERRKTNIQEKLRRALRNRIRKALKENIKAHPTELLLGCSIVDAKAHIESKFQEGMSWDNHGEWHIDHIIPLAYFDLSIHSNQLKAFNYKNLQPLWAIDNLRKNKKLLIDEKHCEI